MYLIRHIDDLGRIVIPRDVRRTLHIGEGDSLQISLEGDKIVIQKCDCAHEIKSALNVLEEELRAQEYNNNIDTPSLLQKVAEMKALLLQPKEGS